MRVALYIHAVRAARPRQLRARALRPVARRRFGGGPPPRPATGIPALEGLWRSAAFEPPEALGPATRLGRFQRQYGEDVLAAARAGDASSAEALVERWIAANPPRNDDAWHPYSVSTRVGNWIAALTLLPSLASQGLSESLWRQLARLERNLEDDVLGNHLIRNARGLVLGGVAFAEPRLVARGIALLRRELPAQILADGGHYERSPAYHLLVLRDLLEIRAASGEEWLDGPIEQMRRFATGLQRPDGAPALFNDGGLDIAPRLDLPAAPEGLSLFRETGYAVVRRGRLWLAFDCGAPSPAFLPAHAHADALSLQIWWDGRPVVVDPGTYTYEPGSERDWFRSTRAHSTVTVDDRDQFELWGSFRAGPLPEVHLDAAGPDGLVATVTWPGDVVHVRRVEWTDTEVVVSDRIEGSGRHRVASRLLLAPGSAGVTIEATGAAGEAVEEQGWVSERFDERVGTGVLTVEADAALPLLLGWRVRCLE